VDQRSPPPRSIPTSQDVDRSSERRYTCCGNYSTPPGAIPPFKLSRPTFYSLLSKLFDASRRYFSPLTRKSDHGVRVLPLSPPPPHLVTSVTTMGFAEVTGALLDAYLPPELHIPAYFCGFNILWTYVAAEVTGNASQVDRVGLCLLPPRFMH